MLPVKSYRDVSKVFFSSSDANLWEEVARTIPGPDVDRIIASEATRLFEHMHFLRAVKARALRASFRNDMERLPHYLRVLQSPFAEQLDALQ